MKKGLIYLLSFFILTSPVVAKALNLQPEEVLVHSWKKGDETVSDSVITVSLSLNQEEYVGEIIGSSGKKYKLSIIHNPLSSVKSEHWKIELREIIATKESNNVLGDNLLVSERPGVGGNNIAREDFVGYLYPEKEPATVRTSNVPWIEGYPFYSIKTTRKIRIEGFYLIVKVDDFRFNSADKNKLEFLNLLIKFQNACK